MARAGRLARRGANIVTSPRVWLIVALAAASVTVVVYQVLHPVEAVTVRVAPTQTEGILTVTPLVLMTAGPATTRTVRPTMTPLGR